MPLNFFKSRKNKQRDESFASRTSNITTDDDVDTPASTALVCQPTDAVAEPTSATPSTTTPGDYLQSTDGRSGIQTVSNPANATVDIWFVHGLTGGRQSTWTHPNGTFTPDLVRAQFPTARIITYGYDADVVGLWENKSEDRLRGHGKALAYAISNSRPNEAKRPIFFISHSLGGLVVEQALLVCLEPVEPRLREVAACTTGIIFMGTPHAGSYLATWGFTLARLLSTVWRTNKNLLSVLKQRSEVLRTVEEVFQRQLTKDGAFSHIEVSCFYETMAVDVVGFVVPEESATILNRPSCPIDANHKDMTKFTSVNDAGFISIKGVLDDWIARAKEPQTQGAEGGSDATTAAGMTFHNGPIKAGVFQQGTGNAGRDFINHGSVTHQGAGKI